MKNFILILFIFLNFNVFSNATITQPDKPEDGWYWVPGEPGSGVNLDIQSVAFDGTGWSLFGALYTYTDEGNPKWYTFQGDVIANQDVYAWREGNGNLATLESTVVESSGGSCFECSFTQSQAAASDLNDIEIKWLTPVSLTITINDVTKSYEHFTYHAGLGAKTINFITQSPWLIHAAKPYDDDASVHDEGPDFIYFKGLIEFGELDTEQVERIDFRNGFSPNTNNEWYVSTNLARYSSYFSVQANTTVESLSDSVLLLTYDKATQITTAFVAEEIDDGSDNGGHYQVGLCSLKGNSYFSGIIRPTTSKNSILYYAENDDLPAICPPANYNDYKKRSTFMSMVRQPELGGVMKSIPFFQGDFKYQPVNDSSFSIK